MDTTNRFKKFRRHLSRFNDAEKVIADYRMRNGASPAVEFVQSVLTLLNTDSTSARQKEACDHLAGVAKDSGRKFAERISAVVFVYSYGERDVAKELVSLLESPNLSDHDKIALENLKVAFSRNASITAR